MKTFNTPAIDIEELIVADVIATSTTCDDHCDGHQGCGSEACPFN